MAETYSVKESFMASTDYCIIKMSPDDLDFAYDLYCQNNSFIDPDFVMAGWDKPILDASRHYSQFDFTEILSDINTVSYVIIYKKPVKSAGFVPYFLNEKIAFITYEKLKERKVAKILLMESKFKNTEIYRLILSEICDIIKNTKFYSKIQIQIEDGRYDLMSSLMKENFYETKILTPTSGPDIFVFEKRVT